MKRIVYFLTPLPNGGVIFQNGYLDQTLKSGRRLANMTNGVLDSQSHPDLRGNGFLYMQGGDVNLDLSFFKCKYTNIKNYEKAINVINSINNGDIDV